MSAYTQDDRRIVIYTSLGDDVLRLERFEGQELLSGLFQFDLKLVGHGDQIDPKAIIAKRISFGVQMPNDDTYRWFDGYVRQFTYVGQDDRQVHYHAQVVPWFWFLTQTSDCRIFQNKTVIEVVRAVLADHGYADFEVVGVTGAHPKWENCVQYRESDFAFISRLLEHEGFFYFFRHEEGRHVMVISDSPRAYTPCAEAEVTFAENLAAPDPADEILAWEHRYEFRAGKASIADYNFLTPSTRLLTSTSTIVPLDGNANLELFDYPGAFTKKEEGDAHAKTRMEAEEVAFDVVAGRGKCCSFRPGGKFKLTRHHSAAEENKSYVLTAVTHVASVGGAYVSGGTAGEVDYENTFACIPDTLAFRPPPTTPKPYIRGLQTAVVVGDPAEEIHVDEYGRIRVQFHWDRYGASKHDASCWMRVVQAIAGDKWGFQFIPRVGQEVIVQFLEGDPDRPICTGSVYHAEHMPPYALPDHKTQSGIKTQSTIGGGGKTANEVRFEDKKGEEQIFIHGEKQLDVRIKKDAYEWVGQNRHLIVKQDQFEHVENNRHETVDNDHAEEVKNDRNVKVGGKEAIEVGGSHSFTVKGDVVEVFKGNHSSQVTSNYYVKAAGVVIEASTGITLKCGGSSIVLDASGVTIKGTMVVLDGTMTLINSGPGSPPTPGTAGSAIAPAAPAPAEEADIADPSEMDQVKADQQEKKTGKYGATPAKPHKKPTKPPDKSDPKKTWVAIELLDVDGVPVSGAAYRIELPDGTFRDGTLDGKGQARVDGIDPGSCKVTFPAIDGRAWDAK